jgi:eukaryotic-like serine/threonine-protein kinase
MKAMSTWNPKANDIFLQALELSTPGEREEYLARACHGDAALKAEVEALLKAGSQAGSFLELPVVAPQLGATIAQPIIERPGMIIGPYKLLEQIGEGGFGVVFMAEQQQPLRRKVALKVLKPGMDTRQVVARFEAERQALALMDHPHIAKVLDAGATDSGRPFFVMELVKGIPITEFCDKNQFTPRQRLELFAHVCQAIQHAHQKGIIHRDIKPSNVLVTLHDGQPLVKVIDFGVAKALGQQLTDKTLFTGFAQMIGTPLYMSPEQAALSNVDVDTRSDIYSLGVLLYELLTGTTPFDKQQLKSAAFDEIRRIIREDEPPKPSTRLSDLGRSDHSNGKSPAGRAEKTTSLASIAALRKTEPRKLSQLVRGDLDWIVMKALEKDRARRYETANGFALDILRYLADEPVNASPPSALYRFRKFARRNKAAFAIGAIIAAALLIAVVGLAVSNSRVRMALNEKGEALNEKEKALEAAEANFRKARQAVDEYFTLVSESTLFDVPGLQPLRKQLLEAALRYYQEFVDQKSDDPRVLSELALTYLRVGEIDHAIDRNDDAVVAARRALELIERLRQEHPHAAAEHRKLAGYWKGLRRTKSGTLPPSDPAEARRVLEALTNLWEAFAQENPDVVGFQSDQAAMCTHLGELLSTQAQHVDAITFFGRARVIGERLLAEHPNVPEYKADLARTYQYTADNLRYMGRTEEADDFMRRTLPLREQAVSAEAWVTQYQIDLAVSLGGMADVFARSGARDRAEHAYRRSAEICRKLVDDRPDVASHFERLSGAESALGRFLQDLGQVEEAEAHYRRALESYENLILQFPSYSKLPQGFMTVVDGLVEILTRSNRTDEMFDVFLRARAVLEKKAEEFPQETAFALEFGRLCNHMGIFLAGENDLQDAEDAHLKALVVYERLTTAVTGPAGQWPRRELVYTQMNLGNLYEKWGRTDDALKSWAEARVRCRPLAEHYPADATYRNWLTDSYRKSEERLRNGGRLDGAAGIAREATNFWKEACGRSPSEPNLRVELGHSLWHVADLLSSAGKRDEAETAMREALKEFEDIASRYPQELFYRQESAFSLRILANVFQATDRTAQAVEALQRAIDIYKELAVNAPQIVFYQWEHAITLGALASFYQGADRIADAEGAFRSALEIHRRLIAEKPFPTGVPARLVYAACDLANMLRKTDRSRDAAELCRQVAQECRSAVAGEKQMFNAPNANRDYWELAGSLESLARLLNELGETQEAETTCRDANAIWQKRVADIGSEDDRFHLAVNHDTLGWFLKQHGRTNEAVDAYRAARDIWQKLVAEFNNEDRRQHLAWTNEALGELADAAGRLDDAATAYREAAEVWEKLATDFPQSAAYRDAHCNRLNALANLYVKHGRFAEADLTLTKAVERWPKHAAAWRNHADLFVRLTLWAEAAEAYAKTYELEEPSDSLGNFLHALLRVYAGDESGYDKVRRGMLQRFAGVSDGETAHIVGAVLEMVAEPGIDPALMVDSLERAVADNATPWRVARLGLAYYRVGRYHEAISAFERSLAIGRDWEPVWVNSCLAMSRHRLGNADQAASALNEARGAIDSRLDNMLNHDVGFLPQVWWDIVQSDLLYREARTLIEGSPPGDDPRSLVLRGRALDAIGRTNEAHTAFAQAFALAPDDLMIRIQALPNVRRTDAYAQALTELRVFLKEHPQQPMATQLALAQRELQWGGRQAHAGQFESAAKAFAQAAAGFETVIAGLAANADSTTAGVPATAKDIAWYRHELGFVLTYQGVALLRLGRLPEAEAALTRGLQVHESLVHDAETPADTKSRLAWTQVELGMLFQTRGSLGEAEQKYRETIALLEGQEKADYWLGGSCDALAQLCEVDGRTAEAIEAQRKAITAWEQLASETKQPQYRFRQAWANERLAALLLRANETAAAVSAYGKAVDVLEAVVREQPDHADHYFNCALLRSAFATDLSTARDYDSAQKEFQAAIAAYTKVIELVPDNAVAHNNLAWMFATCPEIELRDPAKAVALAKRAVELRPTDGTGWNTLGAAQYRAGDWQAAIESLTKSMELRSGGDAEDWYFLAMAHCRLGHVDDARKWHQQAIEWEEKNGPLLANNRQVADELRRFRAEAEGLMESK